MIRCLYAAAAASPFVLFTAAAVEIGPADPAFGWLLPGWILASGVFYLALSAGDLQ